MVTGNYTARINSHPDSFLQTPPAKDCMKCSVRRRFFFAFERNLPPARFPQTRCFFWREVRTGHYFPLHSPKLCGNAKRSSSCVNWSALCARPLGVGLKHPRTNLARAPRPFPTATRLVTIRTSSSLLLLYSISRSGVSLTAFLCFRTQDLTSPRPTLGRVHSPPPPENRHFSKS